VNGGLRNRVVTLLILAGQLAPQAAQAENYCPQEQAIYVEAEGESRIEFRENEGIFLAANVFGFVSPDGLTLDGTVIWNNGFSRPNGNLIKDCPDGDATGDELAACTFWEGVVYAVDNNGNVAFVPPEGEPAAYTLVFTDLSRSLHYSALNDGSARLPVFDAYVFSECRP
jgi:hypothetical protein